MAYDAVHGYADPLMCCDTTFTETYTYTQPGGVATKTLATSRTFTNSSGGQSNQSVNLVATFTYDNEGRMLTEQYPNANKTTAGPNLSFTYDSMGRPYSARDVGNNQQLVANATYGPASELLSMGGGTWGTETRAYNVLLQLTNLSNGGVNKQYHYPAQSNSTSAPWGQSFGYDGFGNLTNVNVISGSAPTLTTSYDPTTNHGTCSDANGNTEGTANCAGSNALPYDIENRRAGHRSTPARPTTATRAAISGYGAGWGPTRANTIPPSQTS